MAALSRLQTVLSDGLSLPEGPVAVMRPAIGYDVSALGPAVQIVTTDAPTHAAFQAAGYAVTQDLEDMGTAVVVLPRSKALARAMIAEAAQKARLVIVDGAKTDGVDSLWKAARKVIPDLPSITKDHGRMFWFDGPRALDGWAGTGPQKGAHGYFTTAGVFSDGAIDKGSAVLAAALPPALPARVADLGAGWGFLSEAILSRSGVAHLSLIEAEALALECARLNITDARAAFHWADATTFTGDAPYDAVVMNPPFHQGRAGAPDLGRAFIAAAARNLTPRGQLWMVANRHLPYEAALADAFRDVTELHGTSSFKIFHATRPKR